MLYSKNVMVRNIMQNVPLVKRRNGGEGEEKRLRKEKVDRDREKRDKRD